MDKSQTEPMGMDTAQDTASEDLFERVTSGKPRERINAELVDPESGDQIWIRQDKDFAMVVGEKSRVVYLADGRLQVTRLDREDISTRQDTTAASSDPDLQAQGETINLCPPPSRGIARILARDREIRRRAMEWQQEHGDPIERMAELLDDIVGDSAHDREEWSALADEPY